MLDDESPTSANLGNDHEFINKKYSFHWYVTFWEAQSKVIYEVLRYF